MESFLAYPLWFLGNLVASKKMLSKLSKCLTICDSNLEKDKVFFLVRKKNYTEIRNIGDPNKFDKINYRPVPIPFQFFVI